MEWPGVLEDELEGGGETGSKQINFHEVKKNEVTMAVMLF